MPAMIENADQPMEVMAEARLTCATVIIPTKNRPIDLVRTLESLLQQTALPREVIIVDQSPANDSRDRVEALWDSWAWPGKVPEHLLAVGRLVRFRSVAGKPPGRRVDGLPGCRRTPSAVRLAVAGYMRRRGCRVLCTTWSGVVYQSAGTARAQENPGRS
jgi:hypothetical protein